MSLEEHVCIKENKNAVRATSNPVLDTSKVVHAGHNQSCYLIRPSGSLLSSLQGPISLSLFSKPCHCSQNCPKSHQIFCQSVKRVKQQKDGTDANNAAQN